MQSKQDTKKTQPPKYVQEISGFIRTYAYLFVGGGLFAMLLTIVLRDSRAGGTFACLGILLFSVGILLGVLAREFRRLRPWTYSVMKFVVGNPLRVDTARMHGFPQKIRSAEVRRAFGLEPLTDAGNDCGTGGGNGSPPPEPPPPPPPPPADEGGCVPDEQGQCETEDDGQPDTPAETEGKQKPDKEPGKCDVASADSDAGSDCEPGETEQQQDEQCAATSRSTKCEYENWSKYLKAVAEKEYWLAAAGVGVATALCIPSAGVGCAVGIAYTGVALVVADYDASFSADLEACGNSSSCIAIMGPLPLAPLESDAGWFNHKQYPAENYEEFKNHLHYWLQRIKEAGLP